MAMQNAVAADLGDYPKIEEEGRGVQSSQPVERSKNRQIRIFVNWNGELEMIFFDPTRLVSELAKEVRSAPQIPSHHKFFIYKGLLLVPFVRIGQTIQNDVTLIGCLLHLVLNEDQYLGKPLHVKSLMGTMRSIMCGPDFYIEDVKEEISCIQGELPPESQRLVFAGQCVFHRLPREVETPPSTPYGSTTYKNRRCCSQWAQQVDPGASIVAVKFLSEDRANSFWGKIHGVPDLATVSKMLIRVIERGCVDRELEGRISVDLQDCIVVWTAKSHLQPCRQYTVMLNHENFKNAIPFIHKKSKEPVHGSISWNFFTSGYSPLRLTAIFPRPSSRVTVESAVIVIKFDREIHMGEHVNQWVAGRQSLVFGFKSPPAPNEICRVRIREFYAASSSLYSEANLASSGVARSVRLYR
ncbi:hypothetical protein GUITHDRAFT_145793 [Guillardia theta CCMP2712]|uniref:Ubiquitin-like domain-containing protein n=1 Tax=Guillardia theta (strain CCMP2712) TaxID=905079 RepID=L1IKW2_GUITC|nr:hypothetical protein GUITHDRAFT_145793 [Guillardia theta CCMP2712]EKX36435.1 hypothetical protein GUITHDRAFT_145793 [Guillardia theta CCMP2712]|eukprot:XP_005823415.1 hypothetical protein GUITHDRAFT_145793 [Guillardia theta CCMP2712]